MTDTPPTFCDTEPCEAIDGVAPALAASPTTVEEVVDLVAWARAHRVALVPHGGGTERPVGNLLSASRWVSLRSAGRLGVVSFERADTVVTVRPGTRLSDLQATLAEAGQYLPNDSPLPDRATIGGIVATNRQGLLRATYGTPRDRVLGLQVVTGEALAVRGGGRTVKNVAGYDLCKLFTGSRGSLGFLTEVTIRSEPIPETRLHLVWRAADLSEAIRAALEVHGAHLQPAYLAAACSPFPLVAVGVQGARLTAEWQRKQIETKLAGCGLERSDGGPDACELNNRVCPDAIVAPIAGRVAVRVPDILQTAARLRQAGATVDVHVPNGIIYFSFASPDRGAVTAGAAALPQTANLRWTRLPVELKRDLDVFGCIRSGLPLMQGVKRALDPDGIFAPGRFAGRI